MSLQTKSRAPFAAKLDLPPPYTPVTLREVGDAFAHAVEIAPEQGAGTLTYVGRFDLAEFAVVLEPDEPLRTARRTLHLGMAALTDALLSYAPPERMVEIEWPDAIRIDGGLVGGGRIAWPQGAREDEPPAWMVFGAMIRTVSMSDAEPGLNPLTSALEQEGFTDLTSGALVESFARHLMVHSDAWQEYGFAAVAKEYVQRLPRDKALRRDIDENGDLLVRRMGKVEVERRKLMPLLAAPSWLDPKHARAEMKLLRTIRLDPSDTFVFERAAEPGEWAVSGAFVFWNEDVGQARRQGALGLSRGVSRHRLARLVHAGADRGSKRGGSRCGGRTAGTAARCALRGA